MITIALSKGRIFKETIPMLEAAGIVCNEDPETSRKLILSTNNRNVRIIIVRATDVPTYVDCGGADIGVAGLDVLNEINSENIYQLQDLKIAKCKMMVAGPEGFNYKNAIESKKRLKVATKYTAVAREFFSKKGIHIDLIKLYGSMELAPLVKMSDVIVDLVSTGGTLKANKLISFEQISNISSQLIANKAAMKLKFTELQPIIESITNSTK
jgi:ATP phosphoribosyltransferase